MKTFRLYAVALWHEPTECAIRSDSTDGERVLVGRPQEWLSSASTAPSLSQDESFWRSHIKERLTFWTEAQERDEATPPQSNAAINELLAQAGRDGFLIIYDLLSTGPRLSVAQACTLIDALAQSEVPLVQKYRAPLLARAFTHPSAAVRDRAALAAYDGKVGDTLTALRKARDTEVSPYVRRTMTDILEAFDA